MSGDTAITLVGNLTADPELRFTQSGVPVADFTVASTPRVFDRASGEWKDGDALFLRCTLWRQPAENVAETLTKGARVIVTGRLRQRSYETREGEKRTVVEVDEIGPSLRYATARVTRAGKTTTAAGGGGRGGGGFAGAGDPGGGVAQGRPDLVDFDDGALLPLAGLVGTLPQTPGDDHPGALGEGFGDVLGGLPPQRAAQEQGVPVLPLPAGPVEHPGRGRHGEVGDGHPGLGETQFRVGGQVPDQGDSGISGHDVLLRVWGQCVPR